MENIHFLELLAKQRQQEILENFGGCIQINALESLKEGRKRLLGKNQAGFKNWGSEIKDLLNTRSGVRNGMA